MNKKNDMIKGITQGFFKFITEKILNILFNQ